jgi:hypothetical protein
MSAEGLEAEHTTEKEQRHRYGGAAPYPCSRRHRSSLSNQSFLTDHSQQGELFRGVANVTRCLVSRWLSLWSFDCSCQRLWSITWLRFCILKGLDRRKQSTELIFSHHEAWKLNLDFIPRTFFLSLRASSQFGSLSDIGKSI